MTNIVRFACKLYPRAWRARYGAEFEALLEDTGSGWRIALDVFTGGILMQIRSWRTTGAITFAGAAVLFWAAWYAGQHTYITPGTHTVLRQDSNFGGVLGFLVCVAAAIGMVCAWVLAMRGKSAEAKRALRRVAAAFSLYVAAVIAVSVATPRTIVSIGDSYCYDLWCIGIQQVSAASQGPSALYTADVKVFSDAHRVNTSAQPESLYLLDEQGHRYPVQAEARTLRPGESVNTSIRFVAPPARRLYLTRDYPVMPWVPVYFGSDISPFHRRTLLRVL